MSQTEPQSPSTVFMNLIATFLAPMFLSVTGGDITYARVAAIEAINKYQAESQADLLSIAQIVAFGLAALGSLSLAVADNLSVSMTLRLRGNAVSCNRASENARRALTQNRPAEAPTRSSEECPLPDLTEITANMRRMSKLAAEANAGLRKPAAKPVPPEQSARPAAATVQAPAATPAFTTPAASALAADLTDQEVRILWASAMTDVAEEVNATLPNLTPAQQRIAAMRIAALSRSAGDLLANEAAQQPPRRSTIAQQEPPVSRSSSL
jgi:hypothetical protein